MKKLILALIVISAIGCEKESNTYRCDCFREDFTIYSHDIPKYNMSTKHLINQCESFENCHVVYD